MIGSNDARKRASKLIFHMASFVCSHCQIVYRSQPRSCTDRVKVILLLLDFIALLALLLLRHLLLLAIIIIISLGFDRF